jgi:sortase system peptidoglycan-associated protein
MKTCNFSPKRMINNNAATTNTESRATLVKLTPSKLILIGALTLNPLAIQQSYAFEQSMGNNTEEQTEMKLSAQNKEEIGFGSGMIIGAILGGPVGAFITGVAGNLLAKNINDKEEIAKLHTFADKQAQDYQIAVNQFNREQRQTEKAHKMELAETEQNIKYQYQQASQLQAENLLMSLQFSTGSSELQPHYQGQIVALSEMLHQAPRLAVDLSGYTDLLGSKKLNKSLSIARVNSVKKALIEQGVEADRIQLFAFGEQVPVVANNQQQSSFYDRRVVIKLRQTGNLPNNQVAKN